MSSVENAQLGFLLDEQHLTALGGIRCLEGVDVLSQFMAGVWGRKRHLVTAHHLPWVLEERL